MSNKMLAAEEAALSARSVDGFERNLLAAAMSNLRIEDSPLRFNDFAYAMRELVRNAFERLAPDDVVRQCSWYRDETGKPLVVSRRQRVYFSVQGGLSDEVQPPTLITPQDGCTTYTCFPRALGLFPWLQARDGRNSSISTWQTKFDAITCPHGERKGDAMPVIRKEAISQFCAEMDSVWIVGIVLKQDLKKLLSP